MGDPAVILFTTRIRKHCEDGQFVLQSRGIDSDITPAPVGFALVVAAENGPRAMREIESFLLENMLDERKAVPAEQPDAQDSLPALASYALVLCAVSATAGLGLFGVDWYQQGQVDAGQVNQGQWWRLATALTLHGHAAHLLSNLGFGCLFLYFLGRYLGYGLALLGMLASGIAGNAINVFLHGASHFSIGASTAVFGALGMLSAYVWKMKYFSQARWPQRLGPIFGGIALLAFTGTAGERTDLGAHLWGFAAGAGLGYLCARYAPRLKTGPGTQRACLALAAGIMLLSWSVAITNT